MQLVGKCWILMLDTHSSLETLEVRCEDWVRHTRFLADPLHHLHLVRHLTWSRNQHKLRSAVANTRPPPLGAAVPVLPSVRHHIRILHMNSRCKSNLPVEPTLGTQSWWPQWPATLTLTACQSGEFLSPSARRSVTTCDRARKTTLRDTDTNAWQAGYVTHELRAWSVPAQQQLLKNKHLWAVLILDCGICWW